MYCTSYLAFLAGGVQSTRLPGLAGQPGRVVLVTGAIGGSILVSRIDGSFLVASRSMPGPVLWGRWA